MLATYKSGTPPLRIPCFYSTVHDCRKPRRNRSLLTAVRSLHGSQVFVRGGSWKKVREEALRKTILLDALRLDIHSLAL